MKVNFVWGFSSNTLHASFKPNREWICDLTMPDFRAEICGPLEVPHIHKLINPTGGSAIEPIPL